MKFKATHFLLLFFFAICANLNAQKFGVVDTKAVLEQMPEYKEASNRMEAQISAWEQEIATLQTQFESKRTAYESERVLLIGDQLRDRKAEVERLEQNLKTTIAARFGNNGEIQKMRENLVTPFQDKIWDAIKLVSEKNALGIVIDKNEADVLFLQKRYDYTDKVIDVVLNNSSSSRKGNNSK